MIRSFGVLALLLLSASGARAQAAGKWNVEFDARVQSENGGPEVVVERGKAVMTLTQQGDSVSGEWVFSADQSGMTRPPRKVRGTVSNGVVRFTSQSEAIRSINGEESRIPIVSEYTGEIKGDALTGTFTVRATDGSFPPSTRKWEATRIRS